MKEEKKLGIDASGQDIIPIAKKLSFHTNVHPNTDGTQWGWIDGCSLNVVWSDNSKFTGDKAGKLVADFNSNK